MTLGISVAGQDALKAWAAPRCDVRGGWPDNSVALGVVDMETGEVRAVAVIVRSYARECEIHFASDGSKRFATRDTLRGVFGYCFLVLGVEKVFTITPAWNTECLIFDIKCGYQIEARIRNAVHDGSDGILMTMTRQECKWLTEEERDHGR